MEIFLFGTFESIDVAGTVSDERGRVQFWSPAHGFVTRLFTSMVVDSGGANQRMKIRSETSGQTVDFVADPLTADLVDGNVESHLESPVSHRAVEIQCGDWFTLDSQGDGSTGSPWAGVCLVLTTA